MKKINFRKMTPQDIEVRIAMCKDGVTSLLLYQDSRTTMDEFDRVFGQFGWQIKYKTVADQVYGVLSVWDEDKQQWIAKEDTGAESNIQAQKGQSSDILKRCAVRFGWGRELYSTPKINIRNSNKYEKYSVQSITIDDNRSITQLTIVDSKNNIVFNWVKGQPQQQYQGITPPNGGSSSNQHTPTPPRGGIGSVKNLIEDDGHLTKAFYREIMTANNTNELKAIWKEHKDLKDNTYFVSTMKKRKGELQIYDL